MNNIYKYIFNSYNDNFPERYKQERDRIIVSLKKNVKIEHVGSTAIPGLGGKGIIDIAIAASHEDMEEVNQMLQDIGYDFRPGFSTEDRFFFKMTKLSQTYHIHLTYNQSRIWKELVGFRDYLLDHPQIAEEYSALKKNALDNLQGNGEEYRKLKDPFLKNILSKIDEN